MRPAGRTKDSGGKTNGELAEEVEVLDALGVDKEVREGLDGGQLVGVGEVGKALDEGGDGEGCRVSEDRSKGSEQNAVNRVTYLIVFHEKRVTAQLLSEAVSVFTEQRFPFAFKSNRRVNKHTHTY